MNDLLILGAVVAGAAYLANARAKFASLPIPADTYAAIVADRERRKLPAPGSHFGLRPDPFGKPTTVFHPGVDVACGVGTPCLAVESGTIVEVKRGTTAGNIIRQSSRHGRVSYMHLDTIAVVEGDAVEAGQQIGTTGRTGNVTGAHLHLELLPDGAPGAVDPLPFFPS